MPSSCKDIRAALAECLQNSDCILVERNTAKECLSYPLVETLPTRCQQLKFGYGQCKRGMVDMRKRFRGNAPISTSTELEGGKSGGMIYAGKGAYEGTGPKATDGREDQREAAKNEEWERYERNDGIVDWRKK